MTMLITLGLPGSGKTTAARKWQERAKTGEPRVLTDRDNLREMLWGRSGLLSVSQEVAVTTAQHAMLRDFLSHGYSVAVGDTNLRIARLQSIVQIAHDLGHAVEYLDLRYVDVETCVVRDAERARRGGRHVGANVIRDMATRYGLPTSEGAGLIPSPF